MTQTTSEALLLQFVLPLALTIATGIISWLGIYLKNLIQARVKNVRIAGILSRLDDHVTAAVLEAEQAIKPTMVSVIKNGKLSTDDAELLKADVMEVVKGHMGDAGLKALAEILGLNDFGSTEATGSVNSFLDTRIEATVAKLSMAEKGSVKPPALGTPSP